MGKGFIRIVIALLLLSVALMGCAGQGQGKANGGGTIIGNPGMPGGPFTPRQKSPAEEPDQEQEKNTPAEDEELAEPRTEIHPDFGSVLSALVLKPSKWILVPPGLPPSHRGLMRSPIKIIVVLDDSLFSDEADD
jgi:hypothetical protein